jgi:hypothetical protein
MLRRSARSGWPVAVVLVVLGVVFWLARAGSLEPPAAPAPTKTAMDETDPRIPIYASDLPLTIGSPGSYYLAENIVTTGLGIEIATNDVTLDLMGFKLAGGTGNGIDSYFDSVARSGITVKNGIVSGWDQAGVLLREATESVVENIIAQDNGGSSIVIGSGRVTNCVADSSNYGIRVGDEAIVEDCLVRNNLSGGITGATYVTVRDCAVIGNPNDGIAVSLSCHIVGNTSSLNDGAGVSFAGLCRVERNHLLSNRYGLQTTGTGSVIVKNSASGNVNDNYDIAAGNFLGTIVNTPAAMNAATNDLVNIEH